MKILGITYYSIDEVAEILGLTRRTMMNYISNGSIVGKKIGRVWQFTEEDIKDYLDKKGNKRKKA
jgi:excisionase family DNA binding protein